MSELTYCETTGKVRYVTQTAAERVIKALRHGQRARRAMRNRGRPYCCKHCHGWHVTGVRATNDAMERSREARRKSDPMRRQP